MGTDYSSIVFEEQNFKFEVFHEVLVCSVLSHIYKDIIPAPQNSVETADKSFTPMYIYQVNTCSLRLSCKVKIKLEKTFPSRVPRTSLATF